MINTKLPILTMTDVREIDAQFDNNGVDIWVRWSDIQPILQEYREVIENTERDMNFY